MLDGLIQEAAEKIEKQIPRRQRLFLTPRVLAADFRWERHRIAYPPSTRMVVPVTKSEACEAKYTAVPASSSGCPQRPAAAGGRRVGGRPDLDRSLHPSNANITFQVRYRRHQKISRDQNSSYSPRICQSGLKCFHAATGAVRLGAAAILTLICSNPNVNRANTEEPW